ncbi:MAG: TIGR04002 family protein [Clostridia bacterium]|nr:TIGR04002 family protein [Clostridia bacterium]
MSTSAVKNHANVRTITLTAVFCALVFVVTAYLPRIPFAGGYVHIGDAFIYLAAAILPTPLACAVGAIGAGLADALTGYIIYAPGTMVIKALTALVFTSKKDRILCPRNLIGIVPAGIICVGGYYLYDVILTGSFAGPVENIFFNFLQAVASAAIFLMLGVLFDSTGLRRRMLKDF